RDPDTCPNLSPSGRPIRLEDQVLKFDAHPANHGEEQSPDVDLSPGGQSAQRSRTPDADASSWKSPQTVDSGFCQLALVFVPELNLKVHRSFHDFVRRSLVNAHSCIDSRIDTCNVAARWYKTLRPLLCLDPGKIQSAVS